MQAPNTLSHSVKQPKLAAVLQFPPRNSNPKKPARRTSRAVLQSAMRDRLRAYRADTLMLGVPLPVPPPPKPEPKSPRATGAL